eukprot:4310655-Alexandrium_andersonii.AAC.1
MSASLVGSEMCIRDSLNPLRGELNWRATPIPTAGTLSVRRACLLVCLQGALGRVLARGPRAGRARVQTKGS